MHTGNDNTVLIFILIVFVIIALLVGLSSNGVGKTSNVTALQQGAARNTITTSFALPYPQPNEFEYETQVAFHNFKSAYNKNYATPLEEASRYTTFAANKLRADALNVYSGGDAYFGTNRFSDLTPEEFASTHLNTSYPTPFEYEAGFSAPLVLGGKTPRKTSWTPTKIKEGLCKNHTNWQVASFDWRTCNAVTPVQDQEQCGSCWAFASASALASARYLVTGVKELLSPEQLVQCDTAASGCDGGFPTNAYAYAERNGMQSERSYRYTSQSGNTGRCSYNSSDVVLKTVKDYNSLPKNAAAIQQALYEIGPLTVAIDASSLSSYQSGIFKGPGKLSSPDHAVLLVGWGTQNGTPYWIVKNSWGSSWGMGGYFHMLRGQNTCLVEEYASYVQV